MAPLSARAALVVDDSAAVRRQLSQALQRAGAHTIEAGDGAQAWRQLQTSEVDVILTDLHMPLLDGLKLIALVRAGGRHQRTPLVVITAEACEADRRRAESLGASGYLVKPVQSQRLVELVSRLVGGAG